MVRQRSESCGASCSKACREKLRRDRLNERYMIISFSIFILRYFSCCYLIKLGMIWRFLELVSILDLGRLPKTDKGAILSDAVRILTQLRSESQRMKESIEDLQGKVKELKVRFWLLSATIKWLSEDEL